jgi:hypothetical protein
VPKTWNTAAVIDTYSGGDAEFPTVAFDAKGNGFAVWHQRTQLVNASIYTIWARRYVAGQGWGITSQIGVSGQTFPQPVLTLNSAGDAFVVWKADTVLQAFGFDGNGLASNHYNATTGWGQPTAIDSVTYAYNQDLRIAASDNGTAMLLWTEVLSITATSVISSQISTYAPGKGWGLPTKQATLPPSFPGDISLDASGNGLAVWTTYVSGTPGKYPLWASRYTASTGWSAASQIVADKNSGKPRLVRLANGTTKAIWAQARHLQSINYSPTTGWSNTTTAVTTDLPATNNAYLGTSFDFDIDANGNALVMWDANFGSNDTSTMWARRYSPITGWGAATQLDTNNLGRPGSSSRIEFDAAGNAIAVWDKFDGVRSNIWAARYD